MRFYCFVLQSDAIDEWEVFSSSFTSSSLNRGNVIDIDDAAQAYICGHIFRVDFAQGALSVVFFDFVDFFIYLACCLI